jgi:hypothetical protein
MSLGLVFTLVCGGAAAASLLTVVLLRPHLRRLLVDLCDGEQRAEFWVVVTGVWIVLVGILAGSSTLGYWTGDGSTDLFSGVTTQVRLLLIGLLGSVLAVAFVLMTAIRGRDGRSPRVAASPGWVPQMPYVPAAPQTAPPVHPAP